MNDPLVRTTLPAGWIDLGIGDAKAVRRAFEHTFGFGFDMFRSADRDTLFDYQPPSGLRPLVSYLEARHNQPVVITSGAKQGLCAAFSALRSLGHRKLGLRVPYWCQLPPAIKSEGLNPVFIEGSYRFSFNPSEPGAFDSYLLVSPGNPDAHIENTDYIEKLKLARIPVIHDAAYNTRAYTGFLHSHDKFDADVEIYSFSKMFGLSGLRVGYCVVRNETIYKHMLDYVETKTVGVSSLSQNFVLSALERGDYPVGVNKKLVHVFEDAAKLELRASAEQFKRLEKLKPHHMMIGPMFGWFKNEGIDFEKHRIHVMDGKHFGAPGFVRINFAAGSEVCREAVDRILSETT